MRLDPKIKATVQKITELSSLRGHAAQGEAGQTHPKAALHDLGTRLSKDTPVSSNVGICAAHPLMSICRREKKRDSGTIPLQSVRASSEQRCSHEQMSFEGDASHATGRLHRQCCDRGGVGKRQSQQGKCYPISAWVMGLVISSSSLTTGSWLALRACTCSETVARAVASEEAARERERKRKRGSRRRKSGKMKEKGTV